jgi:hypothetical protein
MADAQKDKVGEKPRTRRAAGMRDHVFWLIEFEIGILPTDA